MDVQTVESVRIELLLASKDRKMDGAVTLPEIEDFVEGRGGLPPAVLSELWEQMQTQAQTTWRGFVRTYCDALARLEQKIADLDARLEALAQFNCEAGLGLPPADGPQLALRLLPAEKLGANCEVMADGVCLATLKAQQFAPGDVLLDLPRIPKALSLRLGRQGGALIDVPLDTSKLAGAHRQLFEVALPELQCSIEAQIARNREDYLRAFRQNADEKAAASREQKRCFEEMKKALHDLFPDVPASSASRADLRPPPLDSLLNIPTYVKAYNLRLRDEFPLLVSSSERVLGSSLPPALEEQEQLYPFFLLLAAVQFCLAVALNLFRRGLLSVALPLIACLEYTHGRRLNGQNAMTLFKSCCLSLFYNLLNAAVVRVEYPYTTRWLSKSLLRVLSTALFVSVILCEGLAAIVLFCISRGSLGPWGLVARLRAKQRLT